MKAKIPPCGLVSPSDNKTSWTAAGVDGVLCHTERDALSRCPLPGW